MKSKQEVIQEAYGDRYNDLKHSINQDGIFVGDTYDISDEEFKEWTFEPAAKPLNGSKLICGSRLKCLEGIETNNRWIRIDSESDLPKEDIDCFYIPKRSGEIVIGCFRIVSYKGWKKMFTVDHNIALGFGNVTHCQPIIKPEAPIY